MRLLRVSEYVVRELQMEARARCIEAPVRMRALHNRNLALVRTAHFMRNELVKDSSPPAHKVVSLLSVEHGAPAQHLHACSCDVPCASTLCKQASTTTTISLWRGENNAHAAQRRAIHPLLGWGARLLCLACTGEVTHRGM